MAVVKNKVDKCIDWLKLNRNYAENKLMIAIRNGKIGEARRAEVMFEAWSDALDGVQDILKGARK